MRRSPRVPLAAAVLLFGVGGLCTAWYVSTQRAFDAERTLRSQQMVRKSGDRERNVAGSLAERLETLRRTESQRPYFHYQNLYHEPKGASQGLSVTPSPLANGPVHPLVVAYFQLDARDRVTLPTLNDELRELNAPDAVRQRALQSLIASSASEIRAAAELLRTQVQAEANAAAATAARIARLEMRLAEAQAEARRAEIARLDAQRNALAREEMQRRGSQQASIQTLDPSAFAQNVNSNVLYQQLKQNKAVPAAPSSSAPPVEILTSDLEWRTLDMSGKPRLVALRVVHTPAGMLTQGLLTQVAERTSIDGAIVRRGDGEGTRVGTTGWSVKLPRDLAATREEDWRRFQQTFAAVLVVLMVVVLGVIWTMWSAEKLATDRTRFAATAAHELRTPLASLRLYSDLIADENDPRNRERYARELASQTERLGRVVANVLEVTRIERGSFTLHPRLGEIGPAVEECVDRLRPQMEAASCPIHLRVADDLPDVEFDPDAIHHVVDNLVDNAEKYSRDVPDRSISVDVAPEQGGVAITVTDRGPGIAEEWFREPRAFRRAASTNAPAGLGLGLFLVDRIVRGHGGAVRAMTADGGGASVRVYLPAFYKP
ncbi:MAG TPA: HAMP domain-containing sensor histidine kinase [Thermoanaerobaculia bacterium]|nr:HAMP domain-containing sensor histidine kinase [Thermoanaerobaculia bacterium]